MSLQSLDYFCLRRQFVVLSLSLSQVSLPSPPLRFFFQNRKIGKEVKRERYPNGSDPIYSKEEEEEEDEEEEGDLTSPPSLGQKSE